MRKAISAIVVFMAFGLANAQEARNNIDFEAEEHKRQEQENTYQFSVGYRVEAGYMQPWQHSRTETYRDLYLHGIRLGATVDFNLPYHFSMQTGLYYNLTYGVSEQHVRAKSDESALPQTIDHRVLSHSFTIPLRATYTQKLWRELALWFYTGPELQIGLAQNDYIETSLAEPTRTWAESQGWHTLPYEIYSAKELWRTNVQWGLGGGISWAQYRLQAGYNFGLNNLARQTGRQMWEWGWNVGFSYGF